MIQAHSHTLSFWRGRRVLVTGISGFIAGHLAHVLVDMGAEVVGIVRDSTPTSSLNPLGLAAQVNLVHGSITDYAVVERAINEYEVDSVFHLAAQVLVGVANRSPLSTFESNIKGTWTVLEACRQSKLIERVVIASSDKAYGDQPVLPYTEAMPLNGTYPYDASKFCTEVIARSYAKTFALPVAITRCANVYGPGDLNWSRVVPGTFRSVLLGERPIIRSDGTPERDYIFVEDAARAYVMIGEHVHRLNEYGEAFNVGSGQPVSALAMVRAILGVAGRDDLAPDIRGTGKISGEIDQQMLDSSKVERLLGWRPETDLRAGLEQACVWYQDYLAHYSFATEKQFSSV